MMESYMAESLREGRFLNSEDIQERSSELGFSLGPVNHHFGGINELRFACMCEVACWGEEDLKGFYEDYDLYTSWGGYTFRHHRL